MRAFIVRFASTTTTSTTTTSNTTLSSSSSSLAAVSLSNRTAAIRATWQQGPGGRHSVQGQTATVFGCTGFLGRYVVNQLGKRGVRVVVPFRGNQEDPRHLRPMGDLGQIIPLRFDVRDKQSLLECVRHSTTVINLIGRDYETKNFNFDQVHVDAAAAIAEACKEANVPRLIHVSALAANENSPSQYLASKARGEKAVSAIFPDATIVRPATMYGWEDRFLQYLGQTVTHVVKRWFVLGRIPLVNGGARQMQPTYVGDVARALYKIMELDDAPGKTYELYGPTKMTYRQVVERFCELARRPYRPIDVPYGMWRKLVSLTQNNPIRRVTVHDVDRWVLDELPSTSGSLGYNEVGMDAQPFDSMAIRFVRHYRSERWVDQPAELSELKLWEKTNLASTVPKKASS